MTSAQPQTALVLGGSGFFGQRIAAALTLKPSLRVLLAGRDLQRARDAAAAMELSREHAVQIDAGAADLVQRLRDLQVDVVIHTAGPFQGQDYRVARAAIGAGCHYIDLADGRQFVVGIDCLNHAAQEGGLSIISGASSVPALSSAVIERYAARLRRLDCIRIGISSGARAPGLATFRGVFSYAGKPVATWQGGRWIEAYGWLDLRRHRFPAPLGKRWLGNCDVPDLELLPRRYPSVRSVSFQAGFASDLGQLTLWSLAALVRAGVLSDMSRLAAPLHRLSRWLEPWASGQGGMFVELQGTGTEGAPARITWNLLARRNHGPYIPCGAAIALVRKLAAGVALPKGAMPCVGLLTVDEFLQPLRGLALEELAP